jgi:protein-disulfide isomerase
MSRTRRFFVQAALAALVANDAASAAIDAFPLAADDGSPLRAKRIAQPEALRALALLQQRGPADADLFGAELFDYNCGYCRQAALGLDEIICGDARLRFAFAHNPVLSPDSEFAARAQIAAHALHGADKAYLLHMRLLTMAGRIGRAQALSAARALEWNADALENAAESPRVREALAAQMGFAATRGLKMTPTFVIGDVAFIGWPGVPSMRRFIVAGRKCGAPHCGN